MALLVFALRMARPKGDRNERPVATGMTGSQAFVAGVGLTIVGLPGAVPYFGAINLILRDELTFGQEFVALLVYNVVFIVPLAALLVLRLMLGDRSQGLLEQVRVAFDTWGQRVVVSLMVVLGIVLVADGIGWFLGHPLIPV